MPTPGQIIERNARFHAQRPALVCGARRLTHAEYAVRVKQLAAALFTLGAARGERVSILAMNCAEYLEVYGAAEWSGFVLNTVNWRLAPAEVAWILADVQPRLVVFEAQYTALIDGLRARLPAVAHWVCIGAASDCPAWAKPYDELLAAGDPAGPPQRAHADDPLCIIYTSGTTGRPKGVVQGHRAHASLSEI